MAVSAFTNLARGRRRRTLADEQQMLPEEERSLVRSAGETALGGIAMAGNLLDVPGSMVRDTLAGQNPFDQLLPWNWFSAEGRTSGRDLNRQQGLSRKKDNWGNFAGGLATEILTDPLTYATFGASALAKGGQVAKAAGLIDDAAKVAAKKAGVQLGKIGPRQARLSTSLRDLVDAGGATARQAAETAAAKRGIALTDDVLDAPLGGLFGVGLPFRQPSAVFGGRYAQAVDPNWMRGIQIGKTAAGAQRARVATQAASVFGSKADDVMQLHDNYATKWAQETGRDAEEYFGRLDVRSGKLSDFASPGRSKADRLFGTQRDDLVSQIRRDAGQRDLNDWQRALSGSAAQIEGLPRELADQFDAHGTNLDGMLNVLDNGIDDSRPFFTAQLSDRAGGDGLGLRSFQPFTLVSGPGSTLKQGIQAVIVDPLHSPNIPDLQRLYPDVKFIPADNVAMELGDVGKASKDAAGTETLFQPDIEQLASRLPNTPRVREYLDKFRVGQASGNGVPDATIGEGLARAASDAWSKAGTKADESLTKLQFKLSDEAWGAVEKAIGREGMENLRDVDQFIDYARPQVNKIATAAEDALRKHRPWENVTAQQLLDEGREILKAGEADDLIGAISQAAGKRLGDVDGYYSRAGDLMTEHAGELLYQNGRGAVQFNDAARTAVITAFEAADISTFAHESGHVFRRYLGEMDPRLLAEAEQALGVQGGKWSRANEEAWAAAFERFLRDGKAPHQGLAGAFNALRQWLTDVYKSIVGTPLEQQVSPELKKVFDAMLTPDASVVAKGVPTPTLGLLAAQFLDNYSLNPLSPGQRILDARIPGTDFSPVGEAYRLMDSTIREATTPLGRELARGLGRAQEAGRANARLATAEYANRLADLGDVDPGYLRQVVEIPDVRSGASPELQSLVGDMRSQIDPMVADAQRLGLPLESLDDPAAEYFPRYLSDQIRPARGAGAGNGPRAFSTFDPSSTGRKEFLKGIGGGTQTIKEIAQDADVGNAITAGMKPKDLADAIEAKFPGAIPEENRKAFAKWLSKLSPETRAAGVFGNDVLPDLQARMTSHNLSRAGAEAVYEGLSQPGIVRPRTGADDAGVSVLQILSGKAGFSAKESRRLLAETLGVDPTALRNMVVDKDVADDLLRFMQRFDGPQPAKGWLKFVDSLTNFTKGALTSVWPSFHVRNATSGQFGNWLNGLFSAESFNDARKMMRGGSIKAAAIPAVQQIAKERGITNLTDATASRIVGELAYAHGVIGKFQGVGSSVAGAVPTGSTTQDILDELVAPGREQINYARTARRAVGMEPGATLNPLRAEFRGVGQGTDSTWGPMAAGQDVGNFVEGLNRLAPFIKQLRDGVSPAEAAKRIGQVQVDYNSRFYTNFERQVLSRAFPFYKFSARTAPEVARNLMETPGGMLGATIRTANNLRDPNEVTPDYIANSTSIPLGTLEDGSDRYLTGFGMQFEDPLSFLGGGFRGAGMEALSRLNPVAKGPLEWIIGESFFQQGPMGGRDLEDLDGNIGRIGSNLFGTDPKALPVWAEHMLANSPVSRALTTARTLTDPRKGLLAKAGNTLTGMRVSDVSPAAQDALLRERANAAMRGMGARNFARLYVPDADLQAMSPAQRERVQRFQKLLKSLEKRAKKRKLEAEGKK